MSSPPIPKDENNYYHPNTEDDIIQLINYARGNRLHVRARGTGHSMPMAILTESDGDHVDVKGAAPDGDDINILLDDYIDVVSWDGDLVTVQAGIHLGRDPNDPKSTWENSLTYQLNERGLALDVQGGISHQTVAGFLTTGSAGGSLTHNIPEHIHSIRFIDGNGMIFEVSRNEENLDNFNASVVSLGLLGIISQVTIRGVPKFIITGRQRGTLTKDAEVDIFSNNPTDVNKTGLRDFLETKPHARMLWWPQTHQEIDNSEDRLQVWYADRAVEPPGFVPNPYSVFHNTEIMMLYSNFMTILGNFYDMNRVRSISESLEKRFKKLTETQLMERHDISKMKAKLIAETLNRLNNRLLAFVTELIDQLSPEHRELLLPYVTTYAVKLLNEIDADIEFSDYGYLGLSMDNSADDVLVPVMWTEMWVPLSRATDVTKLLRDYFGSGQGNSNLMQAGNNAFELYSTMASSVWLSMSYSDGSDEWKDGAFRVDPYWFIYNNGDFRELYRPLWLLLKNNNIPYRLHWGKSFPLMDDPDITASDLVANMYPKLQPFLSLRAERDPQGIFLNSYWAHWLGVHTESKK